MPPRGRYTGQLQGGGGSGRSGRYTSRLAPVSGGGGRKKKDDGGGGFFGTLGHVVTQGAEDLYHVAVSSPGGVYLLGKATLHDTAKIAELLPGGHEAGQPRIEGGFELPVYARQTGQQILEDIRHPLRHPGYTLLDILPAVNAAAKVVELGRVGRVGRVPPPIVLRGEQGITATRPAARSALGRLAQNTINDLRNRFPDKYIGVQTQTARVARQLERQRAVDLSVRTAPARLLAYQGRKVKRFSPEGRALRMVAEGTTPDVVIGRIKADLATAKGSARKNLERQLKIAEGARQYVAVVEGRPVLTDPGLQAIYDLQHEVSRAADVTQAEVGLAPAARLTEAIQKPGRIYQGATYETPLDVIPPDRIQVGMRVRPLDRENVGRITAVDHDAGTATVFFLNRATGARAKIDFPFDQLAKEDKPYLKGAEGFTAGQHYVGQRYAPSRLRTRPPQIGQKDVVNVGRRTPTRLTHALTGASIKGGKVRHDTPAIVAENAVEAEKFAAAIRAAQDLYDNVAQDTPEGLRNPVAIKSADEFGKALPQAAREIVDKYRAGEKLDAAETSALGAFWEPMRQRLFPDVTANQYLVDTGDLADLEGIKWIARDALGSLNQPPPLATFQQYRAGRLALRFADAVNNAERIAILYLKPAYLVPNLVGNTFLTITQQGFAAPHNVAAAARMMRKLGPRNTLLVDTLMGQGLTGALAAEQGPLHGAATLAAHGYGKVVDLPFRRASFIYEARKELGFKLRREDYSRLLHNPEMRDRLQMIVERANRALIDYDDLNPFERAIIRRVLFFYPWLKGSTKYAADYVKDHPNQLALLSVLGQQGEELQAELGDLPSWAQAAGYFPVGGSDRYPLVVNPTAAGILGQPAQLAAEAMSFAGLAPQGTGFAARQSFTPALSALLTALTGRDEFGRDVPANITTFARELSEGIPARTLVERLTQDQSGRTFPTTSTEALLQYFLGGLAPRTVNRRKLNEAARRERERR